MSSELRQTIAAAIRRSLWTCWGDHVPDGDASLASLSDAGQAGYVDAAAAVIAVLPTAQLQDGELRERIAEATHDGIERYLAERIEGYKPKPLAIAFQPDKDVRYSQADAVLRVLPPAITAVQREALTHNERVAIENAIDLCLQRHWHYEASVIRALAAGHPS